MTNEINVYEIRCISQRIRSLVTELAPENIYSRKVTTKWAQIFNELDELEELVAPEPDTGEEDYGEVDGCV